MQWQILRPRSWLKTFDLEKYVCVDISQFALISKAMQSFKIFLHSFCPKLLRASLQFYYTIVEHKYFLNWKITINKLCWGACNFWKLFKIVENIFSQVSKVINYWYKAWVLTALHGLKNKRYVPLKYCMIIYIYSQL